MQAERHYGELVEALPGYCESGGWATSLGERYLPISAAQI